MHAKLSLTFAAMSAMTSVAVAQFPPPNAPADPNAASGLRRFDLATGQQQPFSRLLISPALFPTGVSNVALQRSTATGAANLVLGAGLGAPGRVAVINPQTGQQLASFFAFGGGSTGGINVAAGDVTGDGVDDIVVGAGVGGGPHVRVFDGTTFEQRASFIAGDTSLRGGVRLAVKDLDGDTKLDIVTGSGAGGGPNVKVFDYTNDAATLRTQFDLGNSFSSIDSFDIVTAGNTSQLVVAGGGPGGGPRVFAIDVVSAPGQPGGIGLGNITPIFDNPTGLRGGVGVAAGDVSGDGVADYIVTQSGVGQLDPRVTVFTGGGDRPTESISFNFTKIDFLAAPGMTTYDFPTFTGGIFVGRPGEFGAESVSGSVLIASSVVPEPAALALVPAGLVVLARRRHRST